MTFLGLFFSNLPLREYVLRHILNTFVTDEGDGLSVGMPFRTHHGKIETPIEYLTITLSTIQPTVWLVLQKDQQHKTMLALIKNAEERATHRQKTVRNILESVEMSLVLYPKNLAQLVYDYVFAPACYTVVGPLVNHPVN